MGLLGNAALILDEDGVWNIYKKDYDADLDADILEWGGEKHKITQLGKGGQGAFLGGTLSIGYRRLGAYVDPIAAEAASQVAEDMTVLRPLYGVEDEEPEEVAASTDGGPEYGSEDDVGAIVKRDGKKYKRVRVESFDDIREDDVVELPESKVGVRMGEVLNLAPFQFDSKKLVDAERRGYLYAKEDSGLPSYGLVIGVLLLGVAVGAGVVALTSGGGSEGGLISMSLVPPF